MGWLERNGWWVLVALAAVSFIFGLGDLVGGAPDNAVAVTGQTNDQLARESSQAYLLVQDQVRAGGVQLMLIGLFLGAIVLFGFRNGQRWAWWATWAFPAFTASAAVLHLVDGAPGQTPPVPVYSGSIVTVIVVAVLLVNARRFLRSDDRRV